MPSSPESPAAAVTSLRFGRERRLRKRAEFLRLQSGGAARRVSTRHYVLLVAARERPAGSSKDDRDAPLPSRIGIVVTRKVGNAVARNRVKRVCRECFRQWPDLLPPGVDLVVVARQGADALGLAEARAEWQSVERVLRRRADEALAEALARQAAVPHLSAGSPPVSRAPSPARARRGPRG